MWTAMNYSDHITNFSNQLQRITKNIQLKAINHDTILIEIPLACYIFTFNSEQQPMYKKDYNWIVIISNCWCSFELLLKWNLSRGVACPDDESGIKILVKTLNGKSLTLSLMSNIVQKIFLLRHGLCHIRCQILRACTQKDRLIERGNKMGVTSKTCSIMQVCDITRCFLRDLKRRW